jgi:hypothetical protein
MWFDAIAKGGVYGYDATDGSFRKLVSISDVLPGWRPTGVLVSPWGPGIAEFTDGLAIASWFMDANLVRIGGTIWELDQRARQLFGLAFGSVLEGIAHSALNGDVNPSEPAVRGLFNINPATRQDLVWLAAAHGGGAQFVQATENKIPDLPFLLDALSIDLQDAAIKGAPNGLQYLDPSSGQPILLTHSILLDDFRFLYPIVCPGGRRLYACAAGHYNNVLGLYDHAEATFLTKHVDLAMLSFERIRQDVIAATVLYAEPLSRYLQSSPTRLSVFLRPPPSSHLGHQLRDELSGLERMSALSLTRSGISAVVPSADRGTEIYGPLDEIFPELAGHVHRWNSAIDFRKESYNQGLCLFRQTHPYVTASLRQKIKARVEHQFDLERDRAELSRLKAEKRSIVLLGLRVENRTLIGLDAFIREILQLLAGSIGAGVVVLDGFNSWGDRDDQIYHTNEQKAAKRLPIDVERELAAAIVASAPPGIEIIDLVGASVDRSLFWSFNCDCFVAVWGAGLAKYRWAANRPGYVLTSNWNLRHRSDLRIYDSPSVMEDPAELKFIEPHLVFDQPEAEILNFQHDQPIDSYYNFAVQLDGTLESVREFFGRHLRSSRN